MTEPRRVEQPGVLGITSSTGVMSLAAGSRVAGELSGVAAFELATERRHAEELGVQLPSVLAQAGLGLADIGLLAVDIGPGRFTGLRVGLATVRGLAFALGVPVVGVSSLEILAAGASSGSAPSASTVVTAAIDARRQEVFQQVFAGGRPEGPARVGRPEELAAEAEGVVLGDGFDRYRDLYLDRDEPEADLMALDGRHPMAADLLALAVDRHPVPGTEIRPLYLREPDAQANIRTRAEAVTP